MCQGYRDNEVYKNKNSLSYVRSLGWITYCGYADPKTAAKSMEEWWPLESKIEKRRKSKPIHLDKKRIVELDKQIRNAKRIE